MHRRFLPFMSLTLLTACIRSGSGLPPQLNQSPKEIILQGQLAQSSRPDSVALNYLVRENTKRDTTVKAPVSATGTFRLVLKNVQAPLDAQYVGPGGFITVFLRPGDSLHLTANRRQFLSTLQFTGPGAAANNYLVQAHRRFDYNGDSLPEVLFRTDPPAQFLHHADLRRQQQLDYLAAYAAQQPLPVEFVRSRRQVIELQRAVSLLRYAHATKKSTQQEPRLPSAFLDWLTALPVAKLDNVHGNPALGQQTGELFEVYAYVRLLPPTGVLPATPGTAERIFAQVTADFGDTPARDQVLGQLLVNQLLGPLVTDPTPVLAVLPLFRAHNRDSTLARELRQVVGKTLALRRSNPAPAFRLLDASGTYRSLGDFRGKVVYLEFWYSNCAPCLAEAPAANVLKKKLAKRDVVFLYISVDRQAESWQKALAQHPLTGPTSVHLLDSSYEVAHTYGVGAYPSYWILDREGRIYQGAAPRPSSGQVAMAALEQALAQKP